jgi:hypothetical protein
MKKLLLLPFFAVPLLLVETSAPSRPVQSPSSGTARSFPAVRAASAAPRVAPLPPQVVTPQVVREVPRGDAPPPVTVDTTIESSVDELAAELGLDRMTRDRIAELTRESFLEIRTRVERGPIPSDEVQDLIAQSSERLHARVVELLSPVQQARYRTLVGLTR